jgi:hypothetical protein
MPTNLTKLGQRLPERFPRRRGDIWSVAVSGRPSTGRGITASTDRSSVSRPTSRHAPPVEGTQVRMTWCPVPLWLVPDEAAAARLVAKGVPTGQVWTTEALLALLALTPAEARRRALAKLEGDGETEPPCVR